MEGGKIFPPKSPSLQDVRWLVKLSKADPFLTSTQIRGQRTVDYGFNEPVQTIRRRLNEFELFRRIAKKNHWWPTRKEKVPSIRFRAYAQRSHFLIYDCLERQIQV